MYGFRPRVDPLLQLNSRTLDPALSHVGRYTRLLKFHRRHVVALYNGRDLPAVGRYLLLRIADARTMRFAYDDLVRAGGYAAGPDGVRLDELDDSQAWDICREQAALIREGRYASGNTRSVRIPKPGKNGFRTIHVQDVADRIVGRAIDLILQPVLDPLFSPFSFGFRRKNNTQQALATLLAVARRQKRWTWVTADIASAFDAIPHRRFLDLCRLHFPEETVEVVRRAVCRGKRGLVQGSPASPLLANLFFHHYLDRPWHRRNSDLPLLRYVDDLLVPCRDLQEAERVSEMLGQIARSAGIPLKSSPHIASLEHNEQVQWLGYRIGTENRRTLFRISHQAWERLACSLGQVTRNDYCPLKAIAVIDGWLGYLGPTYHHEDRATILSRIARIAAEQDYDEMPEKEHFLQVWSAAHARWSRTREQEAANLKRRLDHQWIDRIPGNSPRPQTQRLSLLRNRTA
jgi:retron-type reverse transcriptase